MMQLELSQRSMRNAFGEKLVELGEQIPELVVVTADVGKATRAAWFGERFPERYVNVGISEQDLVGFAAGLAAAGLKPVAVAFASFLMRAWEQVRNTVIRANLDVKLVGTHAGFSDPGDGSSHQALEDIALMRTLPRMTVVVPADAWEVERILPRFVEHRGPAYMRIGRDYSPPITKDVSVEPRIGEAVVLRDGCDVAILGCGPVLWDCLRAAEILESRGLSAMVVDVHTVKPLDTKLLRKICDHVGAIVTVEEHSVRGGLGGAVAEFVVSYRPVPVEILGVEGLGKSARSVRQLLDRYGLNPHSIALAAELAVKRKA